MLVREDIFELVRVYLLIKVRDVNYLDQVIRIQLKIRNYCVIYRDYRIGDGECRNVKGREVEYVNFIRGVREQFVDGCCLF